MPAAASSWAGSPPTPPSSGTTSSSARPTSSDRFLDANGDRIAALGGLTLIDEDPDFLSIAPDLTFRSRSRYLDDATGEWVSETEVIESAAELVELYNPADVYAAFAEAAREAAGLAAEPTGAEDLLGTARIPPTDAVGLDDAYAAAADEWAAGASQLARADGRGSPRRSGCTTWPCRSRSGASDPRRASSTTSRTSRSGSSDKLGDVIVVDDDDERLLLKAGGGFRAEVVPGRRERRVAEPRRAPRRSSSSTTRPTSSVTWPTRWPRRSRRSPATWPRAQRSATADATDAAGDEPAADDEDRDPTTPRATRGPAGRTPRVSMRLAAAELVDSREILPGQWLQAYPRPDARQRLAGRAVRPRPAG